MHTPDLLAPGAHQQLVNSVRALVGGSAARVLWQPSLAGGNRVTDDNVTQRNWTADSSITTHSAPLGRGTSVAFDAATTYFVTLDSGDLTFGNGTTDSPFSIVVLANITDTAAERDLVSKAASLGNAEYIFYVDAADKLNLLIRDVSATAQAIRTSTAVATQGSWVLLGATYSAATGGATAANDITLYENGVVKTSGATNDPLYVAMEDGTWNVEIGSRSNHTAAFFSGNIAFVLVAQKNMSAGDHLALKSYINNYFGLGL